MGREHDEQTKSAQATRTRKERVTRHRWKQSDNHEGGKNTRETSKTHNNSG